MPAPDPYLPICMDGPRVFNCDADTPGAILPFCWPNCAGERIFVEFKYMVNNSVWDMAAVVLVVVLGVLAFIVVRSSWRWVRGLVGW